MKTPTIVNFILDKSGSMSSVAESTISGFNEYVLGLKNDKKSSYKFSLTLFDTVVTTPISGKDIKDVKDLTNKTYIPDGNTALYDAVCSTIKSVKESKNQKVINIIMTDGAENASKEYTQFEMNKMIKEREAKGNWTFVYLGANQDSYAVAQKYGFSAQNISNFNATAGGMQNAMRTASCNTVMYSASASTGGGGGGGAFFSKEDQDKLNKIK